MSNKNIISSFLVLQENILVQQHDILEQNKEINQKLLEIISRFDFLVKQNEKLSSEVDISKNTSKVLQEAFQKTKDEIVELERNQHRLDQYWRRECLDFSGIPKTMPPKELESFVIHALEEIGIKVNKSQMNAFMD